MTDIKIEKLKYPIGKFVLPESFTLEQRKKDIATINDLPFILRQTIFNFNDTQLDTQYRPGGWTARQVVHHLADSHMNSFIRFKLTLTEDTPTIKPYKEALWCDMEECKSMPVNASLSILDGVHERLTNVLRGMNDSDFQKKLHHPEQQKDLSLDAMLASYSWHSKHHLRHIQSLK